MRTLKITQPYPTTQLGEESGGLKSIEVSAAPDANFKGGLLGDNPGSAVRVIVVAKQAKDPDHYETARFYLGPRDLHLFIEMLKSAESEFNKRWGR